MTIRSWQPRLLLAPDGDGGGGDGDKGKAGDGDKGASKGITFASQDELDDVIERRVARERKRYEGELNELRTKLEGKGKQGGDGKGDDQGKRYTQAEVEELISREWAPKLEATAGKVSKLQGVLRDNAILRAASNAVDPSEVVELLRGSIGLDDEGELIVLDPKGNPKLDGKGKPLTVEDHVRAYLDGKPHLVKGSGVNGNGSSTQNRAQGEGKGRVYTAAELADPAFYKANRADILAAYKEGRVAD